MPSPDCLGARLEQRIDLNHPLVVLSTRLTWALIEAAVAPQLAPQVRAPKRVMGEALVGRWAENVVWQLYNGMATPPFAAGADTSTAGVDAGTNHSGTLSGWHSHNLEDGGGGGGQYNQWVLDDTSAQLRMRLGSSSAHSQLNIG
jgi:hypothetical protein